MKKLILVLIAALLVAVAIVPNAAVAKTASVAENGELRSFVEELCEARKLGDVYAKAFLEDKFSEALQGAEVVEQQFDFGEAKFYNLIARLTKSGSDKQIIIGAHYDYDKSGLGAGDNACGVAAMYYAMQLLARDVKKLPCNVTFVAFDGEEKGLLGSQTYVNKMTQAERDSTLVMFNVDTIATGDNLYLMCENKSTDLAKLILSCADGLKEKPYARGVFGNVFDAYGYGYYEMVQGSDHTPFRLAGIPVAFFFSGAYSATSWGYSESTNQSNAVMNSANDTFENLVEKHPQFEQRIETVAHAIASTVTSSDFLTVGENARKQLVNFNFWYNVWWPIIAVAVIGIAAIVGAILYYRKLQKNALLGGAEIKSNNVFEKPAAEEIFSFKSDDSDDIFTYKK